MNNKFKYKISKLGELVGLNEDDITQVLNGNKHEQTSFSNGPPWYPGGRYGTISIKQF